MPLSGAFLRTSPFSGLQNLLSEDDPGVVDEYVDAPELLHGRVNQPSNFLGDRHVSPVDDGLPAALSYLALKVFRLLQG